MTLLRVFKTADEQRMYFEKSHRNITATKAKWLKLRATSLIMAWSRDNVIAILALSAICAPITTLVTAFLLRRRRGGNAQGQAQFKDR